MKVSCASDGFCLSVRVVCHVAGSKTVLEELGACASAAADVSSAPLNLNPATPWHEYFFAMEA